MRSLVVDPLAVVAAAVAAAGCNMDSAEWHTVRRNDSSWRY